MANAKGLTGAGPKISRIKSPALAAVYPPWGSQSSSRAASPSSNHSKKPGASLSSQKMEPNAPFLPKSDQKTDPARDSSLSRRTGTTRSAVPAVRPGEAFLASHPRVSKIPVLPNGSATGVSTSPEPWRPPLLRVLAIFLEKALMECCSP
jgi:hypothetical protein